MLHITPEMLAAVYDLLRTTPPFKRWNLPHSDDIEFHVIGTHQKLADYCDHTIRVSSASVGTLQTLLAVMAHEMIHIKQDAAGTCVSGVEHNGEFQRLARQACTIHVWDYKNF